MKTKICKKALLVLFIQFFLVSCSNICIPVKPEFVISNLFIRKGFDENACVLGGVYFDFYNKSQKQITSLEISISVYDKQTRKQAFAGTSVIHTSFEGLIDSLEKKEMCISLDDYILFDSGSELFIDSFIIKKIVYQDKTSWNDFFGIYGIYSN